MDTDEAVALTQDRLAEEGGTMGELLGHFRDRVSPVLIGDPEWQRILQCASGTLLRAFVRIGDHRR